MEETFASLRSFPARLQHAIHGLTSADLRRREAPERWSIAEVIAHLADTDLLNASRFRAVLTELNPALMAFDQEEWVRLHGQEPVATLLEQLNFFRRANLTLLERLPPAAFQRIGVHPRFGERTLQQLVEGWAAHQEKHLGQIERVKNALSLQARATPFLEGQEHAREGEQRSPAPGVTVTELWCNGVRHALRVEIAAGAKWLEPDYHVPGPEEIYVLSGELGDGVQTFPAGTFLHVPAATSHIPQSRDGCSLFVFYPEG